MLNFEDYSSFVSKVKNKLWEFRKPCKNNDLISEDSLSRTLQTVFSKDFAILSAYRKEFSKKENIIRNRKLRGILNSLGLGVHQLIGHWREAENGVKYSDAKEKDLTDTVERSYLVAKPDSMLFKDFAKLIAECLTVDGKTQDCAIIHRNKDDGYYLMDSSMKEFDNLGSHLALGKIAQAYSQHVKKSSVPFVFEGEEVPSSLSGERMFSRFKLLH